MNILFTSSGRRGYLIEYFREALQGNGEIHVGNSESSSAMKGFENRVITPLITDDEYIPFLLNYCTQNNINLIVPLFDIDLPVLSKNNHLFEEIGTKVLVSSKETIEICNDKWNTYKFLKEEGFNTPKTFINIEKVKKQIVDEELFFPLIIKPRWGMGSIGVNIANNLKELEILYSKCKEEIMNSYLKTVSTDIITESVIIQEKILGIEYGMNVMNDLKGNYINTVPLKKYSLRAGETDHAKVELNTDLIKLGKDLSKKLRHVANIDVDVFLNGNKLYVIDLNARFGGTYPFIHIAGVNLPKTIINWINNERVDEELLKANDGVEGYKHISVSTL